MRPGAVSVFEALAERAHLERALARVGKVLGEGEDLRRLYPACDRCMRSVRILASHEAGRGWR